MIHLSQNISMLPEKNVLAKAIAECGRYKSFFFQPEDYNQVIISGFSKRKKKKEKPNAQTTYKP